MSNRTTVPHPPANDVRPKVDPKEVGFLVVLRLGLGACDVRVYENSVTLERAVAETKAHNAQCGKADAQGGALGFFFSSKIDVAALGAKDTKTLIEAMQTHAAFRLVVQPRVADRGAL